MRHSWLCKYSGVNYSSKYSFTLKKLSLAANKAHLPSILVTNFTFDSVYSYLSAVFVCQSPAAAMHADPMASTSPALPDDTPISDEELWPLVSQLEEGYLKADLLLRLPGAIPIPGFARRAALPASDWVDPASMTFSIPIRKHLFQDPSSWELHPSTPFAPSSDPSQHIPKSIPRIAKAAPLLVRQTTPDVYTPSGRARILSSIGVPPHLHDASRTKILVVSFGGQVIHKPQRSRTSSRQPSTSGTPMLHDHNHSSTSGATHKGLALSMPGSGPDPADLFHELSQSLHGLAAPSAGQSNGHAKTIFDNGVGIVKDMSSAPERPKPLRITSATQIFIPGAPAPACITSPNANSGTPSFPTITAFPPTPEGISQRFSSSDYVSLPPQDPATPASQDLVASVEFDQMDIQDSLLLPDDSWIAIVCGVSDTKGWGSRSVTPVNMSRSSSSEGTKPSGNGNGSAAAGVASEYLMPPQPAVADDEEDGLPAGFYIAPKNIYMPDLMAVGDVLLGKLVGLFVIGRLAFH